MAYLFNIIIEIHVVSWENPSSYGMDSNGIVGAKLLCLPRIHVIHVVGRHESLPVRIGFMLIILFGDKKWDFFVKYWIFFGNLVF